MTEPQDIAAQIEAVEETAHLDGFRVIPERDGDRLKLVVRLFTNGKPNPEFMEDLVLFDATVTEKNEAAQERAMVAAHGMCAFLNSGGRSDDLWLLADQLCTKLPRGNSVYDLVSVSLPASGPEFLYKRPGGTYLKVQEGFSGFTEVLTEDQVKDSLRDQLKSPDTDEGWP